MYKKIIIYSLAFLTIFTLNSQSVLGATKKVAKKTPLSATYSEGWIERFSGGNVNIGYFPSVVGWAYDGGKPVTVTATLQRTDGGHSYTVSSSATVDGYRKDITDHLGKKFKSVVDRPVTFQIYFSDLQNTPGRYKLTTMTFNGKPFKVFGGFDIEQSIGVNHKLRIISPHTGDSLRLWEDVTVSWTDENPTNDTDQNYTIFLTRKDGTSSQGIVANVKNAKSYKWTVGQLISGGPILPNSNYKIEIVKQYVGGENSNDSTGDFTILPSYYSGDSEIIGDSLTRDAHRLSHIRQLASAFELYFNENSRYPLTLSDLVPTYIQTIPTAPTPADGSCLSYQNIYKYAQISNGASYILGFCLGSDTSGYSSGSRFLSPSGIQ